eukprot:scaffold2002_cov328-Prasinococcus_capsulatus_cf.AAC.4
MHRAGACAASGCVVSCRAREPRLWGTQRPPGGALAPDAAAAQVAPMSIHMVCDKMQVLWHGDVDDRGVEAWHYCLTVPPARTPRQPASRRVASRHSSRSRVLALWAAVEWPWRHCRSRTAPGWWPTSGRARRGCARGTTSYSSASAPRSPFRPSTAAGVSPSLAASPARRAADRGKNQHVTYLKPGCHHYTSDRALTDIKQLQPPECTRRGHAGDTIARADRRGHAGADRDGRAECAAAGLHHWPLFGASLVPLEPRHVCMAWPAPRRCPRLRAIHVAPADRLARSRTASSLGRHAQVALTPRCAAAHALLARARAADGEPRGLLTHLRCCGGRRLAAAFNDVLQEVARHLFAHTLHKAQPRLVAGVKPAEAEIGLAQMSQGVAAFNPSVFEHQGAAFVAFRAAHASRCLGTLRRRQAYVVELWAAALSVRGRALTVAVRLPVQLSEGLVPIRATCRKLPDLADHMIQNLDTERMAIDREARTRHLLASVSACMHTRARPCRVRLGRELRPAHGRGTLVRHDVVADLHRDGGPARLLHERARVPDVQRGAAQQVLAAAGPPDLPGRAADAQSAAAGAEGRHVRHRQRLAGGAPRAPGRAFRGQHQEPRPSRGAGAAAARHLPREPAQRRLQAHLHSHRALHRRHPRRRPRTAAARRRPVSGAAGGRARGAAAPAAGIARQHGRYARGPPHDGRRGGLLGDGAQPVRAGDGAVLPAQLGGAERALPLPAAAGVGGAVPAAQRGAAGAAHLRGPAVRRWHAHRARDRHGDRQLRRAGLPLLAGPRAAAGGAAAAALWRGGEGREGRARRLHVRRR